MTNLISRLESASDGSRELDLAVAMATGQSLAESDYPTYAYHGDKAVWEWSTGETPHYTTSLDAALTLVPEGYVSVSAAINERGQSSMRIGKPYVSGNAATPALALCIAALKARLTDTLKG